MKEIIVLFFEIFHIISTCIGALWITALVSKWIEDKMK